MTPEEAQAVIFDLVNEGHLVGVEVFGGEADDPTWGYGLCDMFGPTSVGSDCNRAVPWLMRPSDALMTDALRELLNDYFMDRGKIERRDD